jgi:hypothetical protein
MFPEVLPLAPLVMVMRESLSLPKTSSRIITDEITDEPYNVGDPVSTRKSIKSMEGMSARTEINVHCCRATRRRPEFESSIR